MVLVFQFSTTPKCPSFFTNQFALFHIMAKTGKSGHGRAARGRCLQRRRKRLAQLRSSKKQLLKEWHRYWCFRFFTNCSAAQTLNRVSFFTNHIVAKMGESGHGQAARGRH